MSLIATFWGFAFVDSHAVFDQSKINCFIRHLKSVGKLEQSFPTYNDDDHIANCNDNLEEFPQVACKNESASFFKETDFKNYSKCIMDNLKSKNWTNDFMLKVIYEESESLTEDVKTSKVKEIDASVAQTCHEVLTFCITEKYFGDIFDETFENDENISSEKQDETENYCNRKYVVDNNLIDSTKYNVIFNPKNIDVSDVNCEQVVKKAIDVMDNEIEDALRNHRNFKNNEGKIQCALEKYRVENYITTRFKLVVLSELELNEGELAKERKNFIQFMNIIIQYIYKCK